MPKLGEAQSRSRSGNANCKKVDPGLRIGVSYITLLTKKDLGFDLGLAVWGYRIAEFISKICSWQLGNVIFNVCVVVFVCHSLNILGSSHLCSAPWTPNFEPYDRNVLNSTSSFFCVTFEPRKQKHAKLALKEMILTATN